MQIIVKSVDGGGEAGAGAQESFVFVRWGFDGQKSSMCRLNGPFDTLEEVWHPPSAHANALQACSRPLSSGPLDHGPSLRDLLNAGQDFLLQQVPR